MIEYVKETEIQWSENLPIYSHPNLHPKSSIKWFGFYCDHKMIAFIPIKITNKFIFHFAEVMHDWIVEDRKQIVNYVLWWDKLLLELKQAKTDFIKCMNAPSITAIAPSNSKFIEFGTYRINLNNSEDRLWSNLHGKHRNVIRKAIKDGVIVQNNVLPIEIVYDIIMKTQKRTGNNFQSINNFKKYINSFPDVSIFHSEYQNEVQGCTVIPYSNYSAYYLYGGSLSSPHSGSMNLLHWEAIKHFQSLSVKYYDFQGVRPSAPKGSKLEGIKRFKSRFGGYYVAGYLWHVILRPVKYHTYSFIANFRNFLKHGQLLNNIQLKNSLK